MAPCTGKVNERREVLSTLFAEELGVKGYSVFCAATLRPDAAYVEHKLGRFFMLYFLGILQARARTVLAKRAS